MAEEAVAPLSAVLRAAPCPRRGFRSTLGEFKESLTDSLRCEARKRVSAVGCEARTFQSIHAILSSRGMFPIQRISWKTTLSVFERLQSKAVSRSTFFHHKPTQMR